MAIDNQASLFEQIGKLRAVFRDDFLAQLRKVIMDGLRTHNAEEWEEKMKGLADKILDELPEDEHASLALVATINVLMNVLENTRGTTFIKISSN